MASASHRFHPESWEPKDAILWDDCPGCDENAKNPNRHLDKQSLLFLEALMFLVITGQRWFRTKNEARAACEFMKNRSLENHLGVTVQGEEIQAED